MIVDPDFPDHPKTVRLIRSLADPAAPILLLRIWAHCQARRSDRLGKDPEDIAAICRWPGASKKLVSALVSCRWLDDTAEGFLAHGWRDLNAGFLAKVEAGRNRAKAARRNSSGQLASTFLLGSSQLASSDAGSYHPASAVDATSIAGGVEGSGVEMRTPTLPARERARVSVREDSLPALTETAALCLRILGKKRTRLGQAAEHALAHHAADLPLNAGQVAMLTWFYAIPHDPEDIDLRARYRDADSLAKNLFTAVERAEAYAQRSGGAPKNNGEKNPAPPAEPDGCWEWLKARYPGAPANGIWADLPESIRSQFSLEQKKPAA